MRKILFISILLLIPFLGIAQTRKPIDLFLGIPLGSDSTTVKSAIQALGGHLEKQWSLPDELDFTNLRLGVRDITLLKVLFVDNKAFEADLAFKVEEKQTINYYNNLLNDLNAEYGKGKSTSATNSEQSRRHQHQELVDIVLGKVDLATVWTAKNKNTLTLFVSKTLTIWLEYQDAALQKINAAQEKAKSKKQ